VCSFNKQLFFAIKGSKKHQKAIFTFRAKYGKEVEGVKIGFFFGLLFGRFPIFFPVFFWGFPIQSQRFLSLPYLMFF